MKLSDISNLKLSPGTYVITASFDGNDEYNPVEVQYILVITGNEGQGGQSGGQEGGGGSTSPRPIEDESGGTIVATEPSISFSPSSVSIVETELDEYPIRWTQYLKNSSNVSYTIEVSEGLILDNDKIGWDASGQYWIRLTTVATQRYTSKTITLTLNITSKVNPQIEYTNSNGQFTLEDGVLVKRYYNLEKREGVYMFDLIQPSNPHNLPLTYMIDETNDGSINVPSNKIYLSKEGKYVISAIFAGDKTYRACMTSYVVKFYEGEEPDEPEDYKTRQLPKLSFSTSQVAYPKRDDNRYEGIEVNNPFNVRGVWSVSKGSITADGKTITYDDLGNVIVSYGFLGDDKYNKQTASYVLNVYQNDNPNNLPMPYIGFSKERVEVPENDKHEYKIQAAYNYSDVNINYYYKNRKIDDMILKTTDVGELTITAMSDENGTFARCTISYVLVIKETVKKDPEISFAKSEVEEDQSSNGQYLIQFAEKPDTIELIYESSNGHIEDGILHYDGIGNVVITAKFNGDFYYNAASASYVLNIKRSNKKSPEISFKESEVFVNCNDNNIYYIQQLNEFNNPHGVDVRWSTDKGELDNETNPQTLRVNNSEYVNVYVKSVENETYRSEVASFKLAIGIAKKYLDYELHDDYDLYEDPGTFNLELLRYKKRQDLEFVKTYWNITSSLTYCTIDDKYCTEEETEDGTYIVVWARMTFTKPCNPLISITYVGNADFYTSSNMRLYVRLHNKNMKSPEISFASDYMIVPESTNFKYVLQEVDNPHDVEIVYSASAGEVDGNILTYYNDTWNVVITATSIETEIYESQSITYVMRVEDIDKPSSGIHFPIEKVEVPQTEEGIYEVQDIAYADGTPIPYEEIADWGHYNQGITYDETRQKWILTRSGYGTVYIVFTINETGQYRGEMVSYALNILENKKKSPELAFKSYWLKVDPNAEGKYEVQELINPYNVPIERWYLETTDKDAYIDDEHDPHWIYTPNKIYISVKVVSQETEEYYSQTQSYGMSINSGGNDDAELSFDYYDLYETWNEEGIYTFQKANNPHNVSPLVYNTEVGEIVNNDHILCKNLNKYTEFWVSVKFDGDVQYRPAFLRYWIHVSATPLKRYKYEMCGNANILGELNKEFEVDLFKYSTEYEYEFDKRDWNITCSQHYLTCTELKSREVNGYIIVSGIFTCSWEANIAVSATYRGNHEDFVFELLKGDRTMYINFSVEHIVDPRIRPQISFSDYMYDVDKTDNNMYKLQTLNKPNDVEIDYWEIDYGGNGWETAKIVDNEYVYYEGTDYVHIRVHTKEDEENYLAATDGYSMYVNVKKKWYAQIKFVTDWTGDYKNDEGVYTTNLQALQNPHRLSPIIWSSDKGTISEDGKTLTYDGVGQVKITARFEGNDDYEEGEASYIFIIKDEYNKKTIDLTHCGINEIIFDDSETEYDVRLGKYSISSGLEFNSSEWNFSSDMAWTYNLIKLSSVDEGDYRYIVGTFTFNRSSGIAYTLKFSGNERYKYDDYSVKGILLHFNEKEIDKTWPQAHLEDDEITPSRYQRSDNNEETRKYRIKKAISDELDGDLEFAAPTSPTQGVTISDQPEGDGYYYAYYDGTSDIVINIQTKSNPKYYIRTLTYSIDVYVYVDPRVHAAIMFGKDTYYLRRQINGIYNKDNADGFIDFRNPKNIPVTITSDRGTFDQDSMTLYFDGDGEVVITAVYPGDEDTYFYTETSCKVIIQDTFEKIYLNEQAYDTFSINVEGTYNTEHDVCLLKWPTNELFEFNPDEWTFSNQNTYSSTIYGLYVEPEGDYTVLKGKIMYERDGNTVCRLYMKNNTYFKDVDRTVSIYFSYHAPEKINPNISWPDPNPDKVPMAEKYLIQKPISEHDDVEFGEPEVIGLPEATVVKEGDDYYVYYSGSRSILIRISNLPSEKYYTRSIDYYIRIYVPEVLPEAPIYFAQESYTVNRSTNGIYQPKELRRNTTFKEPVTWSSDKGTIDPATGVLTYDGDGDVTITVTFEGNEEYRYTEKSYVLKIVNVYDKVKLDAKGYTSFNTKKVEGWYDTEYEVSLLYWPTNELFEFNPDEWTISNQSGYCDIYDLYVEQEGDNTVLKGLITFTSDASVSITINFSGNNFFYSNRYTSTISFGYKDEESSEKTDPEIYFAESNQRIKKNSQNQYLVQTPLAGYGDVEFEKPQADPSSGATIRKIQGQWYVVYSGIGDIIISCSNVETETYMKSTIYYTLTIYDGNVEPGTDDRVDAPIYFIYDEDTKLINNSCTYQLQNLVNDEGLDVEWSSSYGTIDTTTNTIYVPNNDRTGITIYVKYYGDANYKYTEARYRLVLKSQINKEYLSISSYARTDITVTLNQQYYINLCRINKNQLSYPFVFNASEWKFSNSWNNRCICQSLFVNEDDQYVYIVGQFIFKTSGDSDWVLKFTGNDYFYSTEKGGAGTINYYIGANVELQDPQISWSGTNPEVVEFSTEHLYLLQKPQSRYNEVEFEDIQCSKGTIIQSGNNLYLSIEEDDVNVTISVTSKASATYMSKTISYVLKIGKSNIIKVFADIEFPEERVEHDVIWSETKVKKYKIQRLYNPNNLSIRFECSKGSITPKLDNTIRYPDGSIDYGYYLLYDDFDLENEYEDILITAISQENEYYLPTTTYYTLRIVNPVRENVMLSFPQDPVNVTQNSEGKYEIQDVEIHINNESDLGLIRNSIKYSCSRAPIVGDAFVNKNYLKTPNSGTFTIYATFEGNNTYRPAETKYTIYINEYTLAEWPFFFQHSEVYTPSTDGTYYPLQGLSGNPSPSILPYFNWRVTPGWTIYNNQLVAPNVITEDTMVYVECTMPEMDGFAEKKIHYYLYIETDHRTRLNIVVNNNTTFEEETVPVKKKIELLRWPTYQNYQYNENEWSIIEKDNQNNFHQQGMLLRSFVTVESREGWYIMYLNATSSYCQFNYGSFPVEITFDGTSNFYGPDTWGLTIEIKEPTVEPDDPEPGSDKVYPDIRFEQEYGLIWYNQVASKKYETPGVICNSSVVYHLYWQQIELKPSIDKTNYYDKGDIENYYRVGPEHEITGSNYFDFDGFGTIVFSLWTEPTMTYKSVNLYKIGAISRNEMLYQIDPIIYFEGQTNDNPDIRIKTDLNNEHRYQLPEIYNPSGLTYKVYAFRNFGSRQEVTLDANRYFTYLSDDGYFTVALVTDETTHYYSRTIYAYYTLSVLNYNVFKRLDPLNDEKIPNNQYPMYLHGNVNYEADYDQGISEMPPTANFYIHDELNYTEIGKSSSFKNVHRFIEWNKNDYTFDPNDWEIEFQPDSYINVETRNKRSNGSYMPYFRLHGEDIYGKIQSTTVGDKSYIIPYIGFTRTQQIDEYTSDNKANYDVRTTGVCYIKFKGKKDGNNQYLPGFEEQQWTFELMYIYVDFNNTSGVVHKDASVPTTITGVDGHIIQLLNDPEILRYRIRTSNNFDDYINNIPYYQSGMYYYVGLIESITAK